ncbi:LPXTG cell wall anchor domain-containing protein [Levilactobacillus paucivorans]|uniref:LPXTG cell wall anchor domain-containing protein n=1 Tax=Levilactobacillus paucivorans TaxID=616990 RepID=UPI00138F8227|nr:LPXTG cell wall anchor domain-containing protein [Levilactobacillus paucivorans]
MITTPGLSHNNSGGAGATVTQTADGSSQPVSTNHGLTGLLPQTSETTLGLGVMAGIILMLLVWIGFIKTRMKKQNN